MFQPFWSWIYTWIFLPIMVLLLRVLALRNHNLRAVLTGHRDLWQRIDEQLKQRDWGKPLLWFHVASAGEYLQAQPVIERCVEQGAEYALTFTSVNALKWIQKTALSKEKSPVVADYLPLDTPYNARRLLAILQPSAIVYVKFDLWPNLIWEAGRQKIPQYLISAGMAPHSPKVTNFLGRSFFRTIYPWLNGIFAMTPEDRERLLRTDPAHPNIQVMGNTRFDSVVARRDRLPEPALPDYIRSKFVMIAGSTWSPDEERIFPALKEALDQYADLFLIVVPHEPTEEHLKPTEIFFKDYACVRWSRLPESEKKARILLVDTVGILSSLYSAADLAYVGGGFTTGIHNTIEPCSFGVPVIFGPDYHNFPEAIQMVEQELAFSIRDTESFRKVLFEFLQDRQRCQQLGAQVRAMVESQCGASEKCLQALRVHLTEND